MSRFNLSAVAAVVVGIAMASTAWAQDYSTGTGFIPPNGYGYGYGVFMPGTPAGATNYGTGVGLGAYYTGMGNYNYLTGRGLEHLENAREHYLHNAPLAVQSYLDRKRINDDYRASKRPVAVSMELATANARRALPHRLGVYEFDTATGMINWPDALSDERFAELRTQLDELFATRAKTGAGLGTATQREIAQVTQKLQTALKDGTFKDKTNPLDTSAFLPAKKFLDSLAYEARFTPESNAHRIAAN